MKTYSLPPRVLAIVAETAAYHDITIEDILGPSHKRVFAHPRHECFYRVYNELYRPDGSRAFSLLSIGRLFKRHHTTVMDGINRFAERKGYRIVEVYAHAS